MELVASSVPGHAVTSGALLMPFVASLCVPPAGRGMPAGPRRAVPLSEGRDGIERPR